MTTVEVLDRKEPTALARLDPQALIEKALESNAGIETMERLVALAKDVRAIQAKEAWYDAMAEFKATCPPIYKSKTAKMPRYSYKFAPLEEVCPIIDPVLSKCGLSYRWTTPKIQADKVTVACIVSHHLGHSESSGELEMPVMSATQRADASGEGGANAMQRVGIALTYAERYSLFAVLGLRAENEDHDGHVRDEAPPQRVEDEPPAGNERTITDGQQKRLWAIAREHGWSQEEVKDLIAGWRCESTNEIRMADYDAVIDKLKGREKK